jgi:hypothetical protein
LLFEQNFRASHGHAKPYLKNGIQTFLLDNYGCLLWMLHI